jgi:hypothetical protein
MDDYEQEQYGNRGADTEAALRGIEEALDLLSLEGPGLSIDRVVEILNRVYNLLDRDYGYGEDDYDPRKELDFNQDRCPAYEEDD